MDDMVVIGHWTAAMLRSSTPLLMVTLGETLTQRVGIVNLGVEGQMLGGACAGFAVAAVTGDPLIGFAAGACAGRFVVRRACIPVPACGANQIGSGIAVWTLGLGLTSYFGRAFVGGKVTGLPPIGGPGLRRHSAARAHSHAAHADGASGVVAGCRRRSLALPHRHRLELAHRRFR